MEPWARSSEETVYKGDRDVVRRSYRRPGGAEAGYDVVLHGPVASVLAVTADDRVVLTRQFRPGPERVVLDLPSGFVDADEDPATAAARELAEETGYEGTLSFAGRITPSAYSTEVRHVFVARDCRRTRRPETEPRRGHRGGAGVVRGSSPAAARRRVDRRGRRVPGAGRAGPALTAPGRGIGMKWGRTRRPFVVLPYGKDG